MSIKFDLVQGGRNTYGLELNGRVFTSAPNGGILRHVRSFTVDLDILEDQISKVKERRHNGPQKSNNKT